MNYLTNVIFVSFLALTPTIVFANDIRKPTYE